MLKISVRDVGRTSLSLLMISIALQACASQSELSEQTKTTIAVATEEDQFDNGCFVSRLGDADAESQEASVICPTVDIDE